MNHFKAKIDDMDDEERTTNLGKKLLDAPWGLFKALTFLIFGGIGLCQLQNISDIINLLDGWAINPATLISFNAPLA